MESSSWKITLPWPPSVNNYWGTNGSYKYLKQPGKAYRGVCLLTIYKAFGGKPKSIAKPVRVKIIACPPDRRKRDLDNLFKAPLDALECAGVYFSDNQIADLHIIRSDVVQDGRLEIEIETLE